MPKNLIENWRKYVHLFIIYYEQLMAKIYNNYIICIAQVQ